MQTYIVLFRGINVGGNNIIRMKELTAKLEQHGFSDVKSYIQSGNLVLRSDELPTEKVQQLVTTHFGFTPEVFALTSAEFKSIAQQKPYQAPAVEVEGKFVHFFICQQNISLDQAAIAKYQSDSEQITVVDNT